MSLCRSVSMLHLCGQTPRVLSHTKRSFSVVSDSSSFSRFRFRLIAFSRLDVKRVCGFSTSTTNTAAEAERKENDTFFADDAVSWNSLGLSDRLSRALRKSGFGKPSLTQAACIPSIMSGKDVIVAAETGSGKTHGYLAPVINKLCSPPADSDESCNDQTPIPRNRTSLVLCPNVLLCEQVVRMANGLLDDDGNPLVKVEAVCGTQGWPVKQPDIIVSTPAALLNNIDPKRKRRLDFLRRVQFVIFDEADMLLCGSFQNQVIRLINMLRFDEKQLSRLNNSGLTKPTELNGGGSITSPEMNNEDDEENDDESILGDEEEEEESFSGEEEDSDADIPNIEVLTEETRSNPRKDWRRIRKIYDRSKQYIFVAATLPVNGKKTAGAVLKHMFPEAIWVSGNFLHHHSPRLKQKWIQVTVETQVDALIEAVNNGLKIEGLDCNTAEINRTMVFANTVEAVEAVANILQRTGKECFRYHKNHSLEERSQIISDFRDKGGIFVCTDAAARGVDIPNVFHVIQADFATSAVDFLHRVGRTARAGHYGLVTSLYTEANKDLVEAIHQAAKAGRPVEMAFSRKRSFRNKIKKRGSSKDRDGERDEFAIAQ